MYQGSHLSKNRCVLKHLLPSKHRSLVTTSFLACKVVRSYAILDTPPTHLQSSALKPDFLKVEKSLTILCFSVFRWIKTNSPTFSFLAIAQEKILRYMCMQKIYSFPLVVLVTHKASHPKSVKFQKSKQFKNGS